jgi:hypothetical protein
MPLAPTHVVVLAAGFGLRSVRSPVNRPKALVEVGGATLVEHALRFAAALHARDVHRRRRLPPRPRSRSTSPRWRCPRCASSTTRATPRATCTRSTPALALVRGTFLLTNCDHVFPGRRGGARIANRRAATT